MTALFAVFTAHARESCCLHRSRKCRCDRFDFSRKQIFSRRLQFFRPTLEAEKSIKVLLMVDLTFVLFFLQNMKEHPFALWNQFSKKAKVSVGHKITCSSNFGEKSLKGLHCFSANTPSVLTLQQCWHCNSADTATVLTLQQGWHCNSADTTTVLTLQEHQQYYQW